MSQEAAAGRLWSVAQATQLVVAMRKLLAQTLSGSTTSDRRRDLFERGLDCLDGNPSRTSCRVGCRTDKG